MGPESREEIEAAWVTTSGDSLEESVLLAPAILFSVGLDVLVSKRSIYYQERQQ